MNRNKRNDCRLHLPEPTVFSYDDLLGAFLPAGRGQRQKYINTSIVVLWRHFHPDQMPLTMTEMVKTLAEQFKTSQSSVIQSAVLFHAGKDTVGEAAIPPVSVEELQDEGYEVMARHGRLIVIEPEE